MLQRAQNQPLNSTFVLTSSTNITSHARGVQHLITSTYNLYKTPNASVDNEDYVLPENNIQTKDIRIIFQDGISNVVEESKEDTVAVHQVQLNPARSQKTTNEIEESTTHQLEQKKNPV